MLQLQKKEIIETLPMIEKGLNQYLWIQKEIMMRDVSKDREFQRKFNSFYRVRRNQEWQKEFYKLMEENKKKGISFEKLIVRLYNKTGKMEASFASKLVATIDPNMPIIDKIVFKNLGLKLPSSNTKNRILIINELYIKLIIAFLEILKTENGKYLIEEFTKKYPVKLTKIKMLDFVLWQTRK